VDIKMVDGAKYISLSELGKRAFPDLAEITAERKASKNFKEICQKHDINLEKYKPNKS